jgi:acyl carrier protein
MSDTLHELITLLHDKFGIEPATVDPDKPFEDYGLDSLAKAELLFVIEDHFHLEYPEQHTTVTTLTALAEVLDRLRTPAAA